MLQGDEVVMGYGKRIDNEVEAAETLSKLVASTNNGVFFGGAGVSTASGIPDFRSVDAYITNILLSSRNDVEPCVLRNASRRVF
mgnify:CR=1 FL=1